MNINAELVRTLHEHGYELKEQIGTGGFSTVFTVNSYQYPDLIFVAKIGPLGQENCRITQAYESEIDTLKSICHPNIICIYNYFTSENYCYLIMEYCPNGTLVDAIKRQTKFTLVQFKSMAKQILDGLNACHCVGFAHRDIKPTNIMLDKNYRIKLTDFGLALKSGSDKLQRFDGSAAFMSPEMIEHRPHDPKKSDIWALGITFFYLFTGQIPWVGNTREEVFNDILFSQPQLNNFPPTLRKIISQMLQKHPESRPSTEELVANPFFATRKNSMLSMNLGSSKSNIMSFKSVTSSLSLPSSNNNLPTSTFVTNNGAPSPLKDKLRRSRAVSTIIGVKGP